MTHGRNTSETRGSRGIAKGLPLFLGLVIAGTLGLAHAAAAQSVVDLDSGTFEIRVDGSPVGTESFVIRRERNVVKAVGRIVPGVDAGKLRRLDVRLQADRGFRPTTYGLRSPTGPVTGADGVWEGDRLRLHVSSGDGEHWKEFLVPGPVAVLEHDVVHHYYLLFRQLQPNPVGRRITVIVPSRYEQETATVTGGTADTVDVGGEEVAGLRYELAVGEDRRIVWLDRDGRVLKVELPAEHRVAIRLSED